MMGSGKTVNGKLLAEKLSVPFHDTDQHIENSEKISIPEIFELRGEPYFRKCERQAINKLCKANEPSIISLGGGSLQNQPVIEMIKQTGWLIYLNAPENILVNRLVSSDNRPMLRGEKRSEKITKLLSERRIFYKQAHFTIDTNHKSPSQITDEILEKVLNYEQEN